MNEQAKHDTTFRVGLRGVAAAVAAGALAWWALTWAASGDALSHLRDWRFAIAPFGFNSVVVVHCAATAPLAWLLGYFLIGGRQVRCTQRAAAALAVVAAVVMLATMYLGVELVPMSSGSNFAARLALRVAWCLALEAPWMMAWWAIADRSWANWVSRAASRDMIVYVALLAVLTPLAYTDNLVHKQTTEAERLLGNGQLVKAWRLVDGLVQLKSGRRIYGDPVEYHWNLLYNQIRLYTSDAAADLADDADIPSRVRRAQQLYALDYLDDALSALGDAPSADFDAALLAAKILQEGRHWDEAAAAAQRAMELLDESPADAPDFDGKRLLAYAAVADCLRTAKRYPEAEAILLAALQTSPELAGGIHLQLGIHYNQAGRPLDAATQLEAAIQASPSLADGANQLLEKIRYGTPICIIRPTRSGGS